MYSSPLINNIRLLLGNKKTCRVLKCIPEKCNGVSELIQCGKWVDGKGSLQTPMVRIAETDYFSKEIYSCESFLDGDSRQMFVFVNHFFVHDEEIFAQCYTVVQLVSGDLLIKCYGSTSNITVTKLQKSIPLNILLFQQMSEESQHTQVCLEDYITCSLRLRANGKLVLLIPLVVFCDDTSGNVSKKFNKFECFYFTYAGLPFRGFLFIDCILYLYQNPNVTSKFI